MQRIGEVVFVQIQQESLKVDRDGRRYYDPEPLLQVEQVEVTEQGVTGITSGGARLIDVHNEGHPRSRNRADNFLSIGFTSHYDAMREKFGAHLVDGIAGENIIVSCDGLITPDITGDTLMIETQAGQKIRLQDVIPAPPCQPFSRYAAGDDISGAEVKATLQFLSNGIRGLYMRLADETPLMIQAGDVLYTG
ncbi:MAG: hypothetical protein ACPG7F_20775 [Aggregatilineales bacterium]